VIHATVALSQMGMQHWLAATTKMPTVPVGKRQRLCDDSSHSPSEGLAKTVSHCLLNRKIHET
jgi:hypothetical protein